MDKFKMTKANSEAAFSKFVCDNYDLWHERIEPSRGMHVGIPDLLLMTHDFGIVPTELKIGTLSDNRLWTSEVRPAQIQWHNNFALKNQETGAMSAFLVGVPSGKAWRVFAFNGLLANQWEDGYSPEDIVELNTVDLATAFNEFVAND
jgi:hypothetical protein